MNGNRSRVAPLVTFFGATFAACAWLALPLHAAGKSGHSSAITTAAAPGAKTGRPSTSNLRGAPIPPQPKSGEPLDGLSAAELQAFNDGKVQYQRIWFEPEGLGPVYNEFSCAGCHDDPVGGHGVRTVTRFGFDDGMGNFDPLLDFGGPQLDIISIDLACDEDIPPQANVTADRITIGTLGFGLVEAIPDSAILAHESSTPPITGRARIVEALEAPGVPRVGRFGWKFQLPTMLSFSADATRNELGITNDLFMTENDPNGPADPPTLGSPDNCDVVAEPEDLPDLNDVTFIEHVTNFQRYLAPPPADSKSGMIGETQFNNIGCANCHTASFTTASTTHSGGSLESALQNVAIKPYSDFLLHDMGAAADQIAHGDASTTEMRTPALWGLRTRKPMWHDGRFNQTDFTARVTAAILEHGAAGSEAAAAVTAWNALAPANRGRIVAFLNSLGRAEFDADGDNDVLYDDFLNFKACYDAAGVVAPADPCAVHDIDQDGNIGTDDFDSFLLAYDGILDDCNLNSIPDIQELLLGTASDSDGDGELDVCECPPDVAPPGGDDQVTIADINLVLSAFGLTCNNCPEDIVPQPNGDNAVTIADINAVLSAFGPCNP